MGQISLLTSPESLVYQQTDIKGVIGFVSQSVSFLIDRQGQVEMAIGGSGLSTVPRSTP